MASADLDAVLADAVEALRTPVAATIVGECVDVLAVEAQGSERRLVARVERRGVRYTVSLADLEVDGRFPLSAVIARYRALLGIEDARRPDDAAAGAELRPGASLDVVVLAAKTTAVRCRPAGGGATFTLRSSGIWDLVPGELATVRLRKVWRHAGHPYASGDVAGSRLDVGSLGLVPLRLEPFGNWDPADEDWGEDGALPEWARKIVSRGPRPEFEMEQVIPGADPANWDTDPIVEAAELRERGTRPERGRSS